MSSDPSLRRGPSAGESDYKRMAEALETYAQWCGGVHDDLCPEDDTCECSVKWVNDGVNRACRFLFELAASPPAGDSRLTTKEKDAGLPVSHSATAENKPPEFGGQMEETTPATRETAPPTGGPWAWTTFCKPNGDPIRTVDDVAETIAGSAHHSPSADLYGVTLNDAHSNEDGKATVVCYTGNGPNAHNNARAIAAMPIMVAYIQHLLHGRDHGFVYSRDREDAKAILAFVERGTAVPLSFDEAQSVDARSAVGESEPGNSLSLKDIVSPKEEQP